MKEINIKHRIYFIFDDMINIKDFDSNLKIDKKSYKNIDTYIRYVTMKDSKSVNLHIVNPLYFIVDY